MFRSYTVVPMPDLAGPVALVSCAVARGLPRRVRRRCKRVGPRTRIFLLRRFDPGREFLVRYDPHRNRHIGVVLAAEFGTLAVINAGLAGLEPGLVQAARNGIDLDAEGRHREG